MTKYVKSIKFSTSGETYVIRDAEQKSRLDTLEPQVAEKADTTAVNTALAGKQNKLTAGANITIENDVISATGGSGGGAVDSVNGKTGTVVLEAADVHAATEAQGALADTAIQPADIADMETQTHASDTYQTKLTSANAGNNVQITEVEGVVKISATGGGSGSANWGSIGGTLSDQTDLKNALDAKLESGDLKTINNESLAGSGNIELLTSNDLDNYYTKQEADSEFLTSNDVGTMASESKDDYYTKTAADTEFLSSNQGIENADKFLKVDVDGSIIYDYAEVPAAEIDQAVSDYLDEHPISLDGYMKSNLGVSNAEKYLVTNKVGDIVSDNSIMEGFITSKTITNDQYVSGRYGANGNYTADASAKHVFIEIPYYWVGKQITSTSTSLIQYGFVKSFVEGSKLTWCEGCTRVTGKPSSVTIPDDCVYFYAYVGQNTGNIDITIPSSNGMLGVKGLNTKATEISTLSTEVSQLNAEVNGIKSLVSDFSFMYSFDKTQETHILLDEPIILSQNGDSIEFKVRNWSYSGDGRYAFMSRDVGSAHYRGTSLGIGPDGYLTVRDLSGTWFIGVSDKIAYASNNIVRIDYIEDKVKIYVNDTLVKTIDSQTTIRIDSFGRYDTSSEQLYGTFDLVGLKVNGVDYAIEDHCSNFDQSGVVKTTNGSFLTEAEKKQLSEATPNVMVRKTAESMSVFIKTADGIYIEYPFNYRYKPFTEGEYPSFMDNWGIQRAKKAYFEDNVLISGEYLFQGGEAELAINVPDGVDNTTDSYVGGGAHGFENIVVENNERKILMLLDGNRIAEDSIIPLKEVQIIEVIQRSQLYQAHTNTNPWANVTKRWVFDRDGVHITSEVTILRALQIQQAQFGMMCVYRRYQGDTTKPYLTNRAIKGSDPFTIYNVEDGWTPGGLSARTYDCKWILEYGEVGYGFRMTITDDTIKPNGGMFVGTNNSAYNKIYFDLTNKYMPTVNEVLKATQNWTIGKIALD